MEEQKAARLMAPWRKSTSARRTCRRKRLCGECGQGVGDRLATSAFVRRRSGGIRIVSGLVVRSFSSLQC